MDLERHACLRQRSTSTGKLIDWPLSDPDETRQPSIPETLCANTIGPLVYLAEKGTGITCLQPFAAKSQIESGTLVSLLDKYILETGEFAALWPTSRQLPPRIRAFVTFLTERLTFDDGVPS
jgi:DNA-binding transcriptional LysR family regulator